MSFIKVLIEESGRLIANGEGKKEVERWIAICSEVVNRKGSTVEAALAEAKGKEGGAAGATGDSEGERGRGEDEDEDEGDEDSQDPETKQSTGAEGESNKGKSKQESKEAQEAARIRKLEEEEEFKKEKERTDLGIDFNPSWRTRRLGTECLSYLLEVLYPNPSSTPLQLNPTNTSSSQEIKKHVDTLISTSFIVVQNQNLELKYVGLLFTLKILHYFPADLLYDYQIQIANSIRPWLNYVQNPTHPIVLCITMANMAKYLELNIPQIDSVYDKDISLLSKFLETFEDSNSQSQNQRKVSFEGYFAGYSSIAGLIVTCFILSSFAQIYVSQRSKSEEKKNGILKKNTKKLSGYWIEYLRDYAILLTQSKEVQKSCASSAIFTKESIGGANLTVSGLEGLASDAVVCFGVNWIDTLLAQTTVLESDKELGTKARKFGVGIILGIVFKTLTGIINEGPRTRSHGINLDLIENLLKALESIVQNEMNLKEEILSVWKVLKF